MDDETFAELIEQLLDVVGLTEADIAEEHVIDGVLTDELASPFDTVH